MAEDFKCDNCGRELDGLIDATSFPVAEIRAAGIGETSLIFDAKADEVSGFVRVDRPGYAQAFARPGEKQLCGKCLANREPQSVGARK